MTGLDFLKPDQQEICPLCGDQMSAAFAEEVIGAMAELSKPMSASQFFELLASNLITDPSLMGKPTACRTMTYKEMATNM